MPRLTIILLALLAALTNSAAAEEWVTTNKQHPWGPFLPGSWKLVRIKTDTLDAEGKVVSTTTTDTMTTLVETNSTCYTLMIDSEINLRDARYRGKPKLVKRYYRADLNGEIIADTRLRNEEMKFDRNIVASEVRRIVYKSKDWTRTSKVFYSPTKSPYILKRETKGESPDGEKGYETQVTAKTIGQVRRVVGEPKVVNEIEVVHTEGKVEIRTIESHCANVPGAVVAHEMEKLMDGVVVSRSRMELIDYYVSPGRDKSRIRRGRRGLLPWRRNRR